MGRSALNLFFRPDEEPQQTEVAGIKFPNRVGLAAGMDKNGTAALAWQALGFGFAEFGTVTAEARRGNKKPRMWRFPQHEAVVNYMGLNNRGVNALYNRLSSVRQRGLNIPFGVSIGHADMTTEEAIDNEDYSFMLRLLNLSAVNPDYFALNVSCPNVDDADKLHAMRSVSRLAEHVANKNRDFKNNPNGATTPVFLKISPDLEPAQIDEVLGIIEANKLAGIIACNTTTDRSVLGQNDPGKGGLSGKPLFERSFKTVKFIRENDANIPVIACGGITTAERAKRMLEDAGANLVQVLTGLVFNPALAQEINGLYPATK
jgi:dihydroorotate dehydrogenase